MTVRRAVLVALLIAALAGGVWWHARPPVVTVGHVVRGPVVEAVYATGIVEPRRWAQIAPTVAGRIMEYPVEEGRKVRKGDVLVRLDDRTARAVLQELEARIVFLEGEVERYLSLMRREAASQQAYQRIKSEYDQARAAAEAARRRLADMTLLAPFEGIVLRKDGEVGEAVKTETILLWVGSEPPYRITADVDEEDIPRVRLGQTALVKADAFPDRVFGATVSEITPKGDPVNKQYRVRLDLPPDSPLLVGMTVEVNVVVRRDETALLVPAAAVVPEGVFVLDETTVRLRRVRLGVHGPEHVEVRDGLTEGQPVIVAPPRGLTDAATVRPRAAAAP